MSIIKIIDISVPMFRLPANYENVLEILSKDVVQSEDTQTAEAVKHDNKDYKQQL